MGTPDFAVPALRRIAEDTPHQVIAVYSQPPRPKGRGHKVQKSPVHEYAESQGIEVFTPLSLKTPDDQKAFLELNADVAIVAAYGLILPKVILDAPRYGCINIHASLLPRWRGASPIQQSVWHGDAKSGVSIMQMDIGLDTGPVIVDGDVPILADTTASSLHNQLSDIGGQLIVKTLDMLSILPADQNRLPSIPQDDPRVTYAPLLKKEDGHIHWAQTAEAIDRQIRALNPWPGVVTYLGDQAFKVLEASIQTDQTSDDPVGTVLNKKGDVICGDGTVLRIQILQPHGKKAMDFSSAINGGYIKPGDIFNK